jgi:UDP:flavonoid glycosyltransferase YjiC (YdhE family)
VARRSRGTILFVQEQGRGIGHLTNLLPFADRVAQEGWRPVFLVGAPRLAWAVIDRYPVLRIPEVAWDLPRVLPHAPVRLTSPDAGRRLQATGSLTGWMSAYYRSDGHAAALIRLWDDLIASLSPRAIFSDMSFSSMIVAHRRIPHVWVSSGYLMPPRSGTGFAPHAPMPRSSQTRLEAKVLGRINFARRSQGLSELKEVYDLARDCCRLLCTIPELDFGRFRALRTEPYHRPSVGCPALRAIPSRGRFLAYLSTVADDNPNIIRIIQGLIGATPGGTLVCSGLSPSRRELLEAGIKVSETLVDLQRAVPSSSLVVHYGGLGTMLAALYSGRPQVLFPTHAEQASNARALEGLGLGKMIPLVGRRLRAREVAAAVTAMLEDSVQERAYRFAAQLVARRLPDPVEAAVTYLRDNAGA